MSNLGLNAFATDVKAEEEGIWEDVGSMKFLVAKAGNDSWKKEVITLENKSYGPVKRRDKDFRDAETDAEIFLKVLARTCILDWKDVELDEKKIPFSKGKSLEILLDKRFRPLADHLLDLALNQERFMEESIKEDEELAKNS